MFLLSVGMFDPTILFVAAAAFFAAGAIKGIAGLGLPTAAIAGMTLVLEPRTAITVVLFPMVVLNCWQWVTAGHIFRTAKRYAWFGVVLFVCVVVTTFATKDIASELLMIALGCVIILFVIASWTGQLPPIPASADRLAQIGFGLFSGLIGGMTAAWAAPLGMYLNMRRLDKDEFIRASGFLISVGSVPMCIAYAQIGFLTGPLALTSLVMVCPALIGFWLGAVLRNSFSQDTFRRVVLAVFLLLAINLIRKAVWS